MPYRALPLKPTAGQPWRDFGDATYDNVAQFLVDIPALKADVANVAAQAAGLSSRAPLNFLRARMPLSSARALPD